MNNTLKLLTVSILIISSMILSSAMLTDGHIWGSDFPSYIMQAKSVAEGSPAEFIKHNLFTTEKAVRMIYPWGTPVLLAPFFKIFGLNMLALKMLNIVCYILFLITTVLFLYKKLDTLFLCLFVALFAFNPTILYIYLNNISSDIPFLFFSTLTIFLIGRVIIEQRPVISYMSDRILIGILFSLSFFIRTNGILLVLTYFLTQNINLIQQARLADGANNQIVFHFYTRFVSYLKSVGLKIFAINLLPYIIFILFILIWHYILPQGGSFYISNYSFMPIKQILKQLLYYIVLPTEFFDGIPYNQYLYFAPLTFVLVSITRTANYNYHMVVYLFVSLLLLVTWPFIEGIRLIFPILPFYIYLMCNELQRLYKYSRLSKSGTARCITKCILLVVILYFAKDSLFIAFSNLEKQRKISYGPFTKESSEMFAYIRNNVPENASIVFLFTREMSMLTNRKSIMVEKPCELIPGSYFCVIRNIANGQFRPITIENLVKDKKLFQIYSNSNFILYRIQHPQPCAPTRTRALVGSIAARPGNVL